MGKLRKDGLPRKKRAPVAADRDGEGPAERLRVVRNRLLYELEQRTNTAGKRGELGAADLDRFFRLVLDAEKAALDPGRDRETVMEIVTSVPMDGFEADDAVAVPEEAAAEVPDIPVKRKPGRPKKVVS